MIDYLGIISFLLGLLAISWNVIDYLYTKIPTIDFSIDEIKPYHVRIYLINSGDIKGKIKELKIFNSITKTALHFSDFSDIIIYSKNRTDNIYWDLSNERNLPDIYQIRIDLTVTRKILWFSKDFPFSRKEFIVT